MSERKKKENLPEESVQVKENPHAKAEKDQNPAPVPSKDQLQRELAASKADFTHTPMEITPDLEELLADALKEDKKNTKRSAQMIGVLAKHNFYANGLTPVELRTTLEDLGRLTSRSDRSCPAARIFCRKVTAKNWRRSARM